MCVLLFESNGRGEFGYIEVILSNVILLISSDTFASMMAARNVQSLLAVLQTPSLRLVSGSSPEESTTRAGPHAETSKQVQMSSSTIIPLFIYPPDGFCFLVKKSRVMCRITVFSNMIWISPRLNL